MQEKCGVVGIASQKLSNSFELALLAARGVQHRGLQGAGMALNSKKGLKVYRGTGTIDEVFTNDVVPDFDIPNNWIMVHCRYGTYGDYDQTNLQPCIASSPAGEKVAVIHNGQFAGLSDLKSRVEKLNKKTYSDDTSDTYLFTQLLVGSKGKSWDEKIVNCVDKCSGAFSLLIGVGKDLYAVRDKFGIRPLFIGKVSGSYMVASETHAFNKVDGRVEREVGRGEVIKLNSQGMQSLTKKSKNSHFCDFEFAYFSRPDSLYASSKDSNVKDWSSYGSFRERCGEKLAVEKPIINADFVVGVPSSGVSLATGYAAKLGLPYRQAIIRDHFDPFGAQRLFMRDDVMNKISSRVLGKLSISPDLKVWKDKIVVIGDDSIVRGNVSKKVTETIFKLGAREVHWIIGFPPLMNPCHLGVSIRSDGELVAPKYGGDPAKIAKKIGATSVNYISNLGFIEAKYPGVKVTIPKNRDEIFVANGGCGGCITGLYPVDKNGKYYKNR